MKISKRSLLAIQLVIICFLFAGCQKGTNIEIETLAIEPEKFHYIGTEQVDIVTVDENGLLYTSDFISSDSQTEEGTQRFCIYDLDGNCIQQKDITLGNAVVHAMVIEDGILYCVVPVTGKGEVLVAIDLTTWEVTEQAVIGIEDFYYISKMVMIEDYFYFFGKSPMAEEVSFMIPEDVSVPYTGEVIARMSRVEQTPQVEFLEITLPLDVFKTKENTLMIYYYDEENGFGFLEFSPQKQTLKKAGWKFSLSPMKSLSSCEDGYLFLRNSMLYYGTVGGVEAQITTDQSYIWREAIYRKGFAFYYDYTESVVERVCVTDTLKENKTIRLLVNAVDAVQMYGCGYQMLRQEVDMETFSLKVLARDADFDLYLLNSRYPNAYNIKKNGAFYALNEVSGVQEYLDACFPNLKEVAINEEGDIWMLPIRLDMPLLLYDKVYCEAQGVDFSTMDYQEFLAFTERAEQEDAGKILNVKIISEFFGQYFQIENSFDTEVFQRHAKQLKSLYDALGEDMDYIVSKESAFKILPQFFYEYVPFQNFLFDYASEIEIAKASERVGIMDIPKIAEGIPNLGTVTFFAVNPQSENLEATLAYISTLCRYLMTLENSFLLADTTTYINTPFIRECYDLYATGEIYFAMEEVVYLEAFQDYLKGTMTLEEMIKEVERRLEIYLKE